jgi:hypothetical protein
MSNFDASHSGWYSVPGNPGHGLNIEVIDGKVFGVWYNFDQDRSQASFLLQHLVGDVYNLYRPRGTGRLAGNFELGPSVGSASMEIVDQNMIRFSFNLGAPGVDFSPMPEGSSESGTILYTRLTPSRS